MNAAKKVNALIEISPGSPEWDAWLAHHRGTKTETRMLLCLGGTTKTGDVIPPRPWLARSKFPPVAPQASAGTRSFQQTPRPPLPTERRSTGDGEFDKIAARLEVKAERVSRETAEQKKRRKLSTKSDRIRDDALLAAQRNRRPDIGDVEGLAVVLIQDPNEAQHLVRVGRGPPMRIAVKSSPQYRVASLRDDPIAKMAKLGRLGIDNERDVRLMAARRWQEFYSMVAPQRGIDPSADIVDGGRVDDVAEMRLTAIKLLSRASRVLGIRNEHMIFELLGAGRSIEEYLRRCGQLEGSATHRQKVVDAYVEILRGCLDDLAVEFQMMAEGKGPKRAHDQFDFLSSLRSRPRAYDQATRPDARRSARASTIPNATKPVLRLKGD
jgi:hypothetical protein